MRPIVNAAHHGVEQGKKRNEGDEHGADVQREVEAVAGAAGDGAEEIGLLFHRRHLDAAGGERLLGFGNEHFGHEERAGGRHDDGSEEIFWIGAANLNVPGHHSAGNMGHAAGHHAHQFGLGELGKKRADGERGFGLAHEDAGGDVERFCAAGAHDAGHQPRGGPDDELHDADVIKHGEESGDEDDRGKHLEGERKTEAREFFRQAEIAENKSGACVGEAEKLVRSGAEKAEDFTAERRAKDEVAKRELQAEAPQDCLQLDGLPRGGKKIRSGKDDQHAEDCGESCHSVSLCFDLGGLRIRDREKTVR